MGFKGNKEWLDCCAAGEHAHAILSISDENYRDVGWMSWPDWLRKM